MASINDITASLMQTSVSSVPIPLPTTEGDKPATVSQVTSHLHRTSVSTTAGSPYHCMTLQYPVVDLLPAQNQYRPFLEPPKHICLRSVPDAAIDELGQDNDTFFVRLPLSSAAFLVPNLRGQKNIADAVKQLSLTHGRSTLNVATFFDEESGRRWYRMQLATEKDGNTSFYDADMLDSNWFEIQHEHRDQLWVQLLDNLISRASERAYFHVQRRLEQSLPLRVVLEERIGTWGLAGLKNANETLAMRMQEIQINGTMRLFMPVQSLNSPIDNPIDVLLPCDHVRRISTAMLRLLPENSCKSFACEACGEKVISADDLNQLHWYHELQAKKSFAETAKLWRELEDQKMHDEKNLTISGNVLYLAAQHALESLKAPDSIVPTSMCFAKFAEPQAILSELRLFLDQNQGMVNGSLEDVLSSLDAIKNTALAKHFNIGNGGDDNGDMPAGWNEFVRRWFVRTVRLVAVEGYDGRAIGKVLRQENYEPYSMEEQEHRLMLEGIESVMRNTDLRRF